VGEDDGGGRRVKKAIVIAEIPQLILIIHTRTTSEDPLNYSWLELSHFLKSFSLEIAIYCQPEALRGKLSALFLTEHAHLTVYNWITSCKLLAS
jgi:hypothetical protein